VADCYEVWVDNDPDFSSPEVLENATDNFCTVGSELVEGIYYWRVRAYKLDEISDFSSVWSFRVDVTPPAKTTPISPTDGANLNDSTPALSWGAVNSESDGGPENSLPVLYRVWVDNDSDFSSPEADSGWIQGTSWEVTPELSEDDYYWRVGIMDNAGNVGDNSGVRTFHVNLTSPPAPTITHPTDGENLNDDTPTISWNPVIDSSEPVLYRVWLDNDPDFSSPEADSGWIQGTSYQSGHLQDGLYYLRVGAMDNAGNIGENSQLSFRVDTLPPGPPAITYPSDGESTNDNTPTITWTPPEENSLPLTYDLWIDNDPDFSSPEDSAAGLTGTSYTSAELQDGLYYLRVRAVDNAGNVGDNAQISFRVDTVAPSAPGLLSPENNSLVSTNTPTFAWTAVEDDSGVTYELVVDNESGFDPSFHVYHATGITTRRGSWATDTSALARSRRTTTTGGSARSTTPGTLENGPGGSSSRSHPSGPPNW